MRQWENSRSCTWKIAKSQARGSSVERVAPLCNCRGCRVNVHLSQLAGPSVPSYGSSLCKRVCVYYMRLRVASCVTIPPPRVRFSAGCATFVTRLLCNNVCHRAPRLFPAVTRVTRQFAEKWKKS